MRCLTPQNEAYRKDGIMFVSADGSLVTFNIQRAEEKGLLLRLKRLLSIFLTRLKTGSEMQPKSKKNSYSQIVWKEHKLDLSFVYNCVLS